MKVAPPLDCHEQNNVNQPAVLASVDQSWPFDALLVFEGDCTCCFRKHDGLKCDKPFVRDLMLGLYAEVFNLKGKADSEHSCRSREIYESIAQQKDRVFPMAFSTEITVKTSIARKKISHQQLKFFKDILQELEDLAASDRPEAQDLFGALEQQNPFGQDPHHDVPCQAQCQRWCSSFTKWESRQTPRPRVNTVGKFLPLPMTLSAEERKWTEWAFSLAPSSDKPWHDIKKANRKAWLWVLIFAISFLYCGSLSLLDEKQRCYKSVSQY